MSILLAELYNTCNPNFHLQLLAGKSGLSNYVSWPHVMENIGAIDFLAGHELIFITGVGKSGNNWLKKFILGLIERNCAGIVVNIGPFIDSIPEDLIHICDEKNFPIFTVPWHVHLSNIISSFSTKMVLDEHNSYNIINAFIDAIHYPSMTDTYLPVLTKNNYPPTALYCVVLIKIYQEFADVTPNYITFTDNILLLLKHHIASYSSQACFFQDNDMFTIILLDPNKEAVSTLINQIIYHIKEQYPQERLFVGISKSVQELSNIHTMYIQANQALTLAIHRNINIKYFDDSAIDQLLLSVNSNETLQIIHDDILTPLLNYDKKNHTELTYTLKNYLFHNSSIQAVADETFTHRNTINYRIHKAKEILNVDLTDSLVRFQLMLAFLIEDFI